MSTSSLLLQIPPIVWLHEPILQLKKTNQNFSWSKDKGLESPVERKGGKGLKRGGGKKKQAVNSRS